MEWQDLIESQQKALARVLSDAILADKVIDENEINRYQELVGNNVEHKLFSQAKQLTLAKAVEIWQKCSEDQKKYFHDILKGVIKSDGVCSPAEAKFLTAIDYCVSHNQLFWHNNRQITKYELKSFKLGDMPMGHRFVFYVEDKDNKELNNEIVEHYGIISNLLASIGFQFIYIPKLVELYILKGEKIFESMAMFLFPDIESDRVKQAYENIKKMTTSNFVTQYLRRKMGFNIDCVTSSLLVMLGNSNVLTNRATSAIGLRYDRYANMLKINLQNGDSVVDTISQFIEDYNKNVTFNHFTDFDPSHTKLLYQGIYKFFFNLVALAKNREEFLRIDINTDKKTLSINGSCINAPSTLKSLYALIICSSVLGDRQGIPNIDTATQEQMGSVHLRYISIHEKLKNTKKTISSNLYKRLTINLSELRNIIKNTIHDDVKGFVRFSANKYIKVLVQPENVFVDDIPIAEHPEWKDI